jgi:hypothetical protein
MKRGKEIFGKVREHIKKMADERENNLPGLEKLDRRALTKTCLALGQMFQLLDGAFLLLLMKRGEVNTRWQKRSRSSWNWHNRNGLKWVLA